ncbi:hypothetical protein SJA_C1-07690 [Sphingobium indicum UT26S]|uniref:Uncharacterized protein n=1 Tax=Sphingobium indicum (strain DSM 16413 / CCM 7287 / MTCC 6362 / UT26 / NBRC 101211 / UT26S) TaxID=452662 RepID=D4YZ21_SPHIU|nr:hypothetical protein SJA_C1-07690 [Sphingobium indicum UT26S]
MSATGQLRLSGAPCSCEGRTQSGSLRGIGPSELDFCLRRSTLCFKEMGLSAPHPCRSVRQIRNLPVSSGEGGLVAHPFALGAAGWTGGACSWRKKATAVRPDLLTWLLVPVAA